MVFKTMPFLLRKILPSRVQGICLPPWGIYIRDLASATPELKTHELVHWQQYKRYGFWMYYIRYLWYSIRHGYRNNPMEVEAREGERFIGPHPKQRVY